MPGFLLETSDSFLAVELESIEASPFTPMAVFIDSLKKKNQDSPYSKNLPFIEAQLRGAIMGYIQQNNIPL